MSDPNSNDEPKDPTPTTTANGLDLFPPGTFQVGKPELPEVIKYTHHGVEVSVIEAFKGKHRAACLCYLCGNFLPGSSSNCKIAQRVYELCVEENIVTPVYECPKFTPKAV